MFEASKTSKRILANEAVLKIKINHPYYNAAKANVGSGESFALAIDKNDNVTLYDPMHILVGYKALRTNPP